MGSISFLIGIPSVLSSGGLRFFTKIDFMGWMNFFFGNVALAFGAFLICFFLAYVWGVKKAIGEITLGNNRFKMWPLWTFSVKFFTPIAIIIILIFIRTIAG